MTTLKKKRLKRGLLQVELAQIAGVYPSTLSRFERGWLIPSKETADKIAVALGCKADEIFNLKNKSKEETHGH